MNGSGSFQNYRSKFQTVRVKLLLSPSINLCLPAITVRHPQAPRSPHRTSQVSRGAMQERTPPHRRSEGTIHRPYVLPGSHPMPTSPHSRMTGKQDSYKFRRTSSKLPRMSGRPGRRDPWQPRATSLQCSRCHSCARATIRHSSRQGNFRRWRRPKESRRSC
jgi:hypothetical protein